MENTVIVAFHHKKRNTWLDMEIPLDISANELIYCLIISPGQLSCLCGIT